MTAKQVKKNTSVIGNLNTKYLVQKSDPLLLMRSVPFSLGELKILDTYISRINADDDTHRTVIFTKEEYEELMGLTCVDYRTLKKHTEGMLGKVVSLEMSNKEYLQFVLFEKALYHKDEYGKPIIEITCSSLAKDLFFCIGKYHYFSYALENVIKLTRKASYLLYLYIRYNRYRSSWEIELNELRDTILDCKKQESYQVYKEFKRAVLEPAVKEVNKKTDCHFTYEAIKRGRKVAKIKFVYHSKTEKLLIPQTKNVNQQDKIEVDYGGELANMLAETCNYEFDSKQIRYIQDLVLQATKSNDNVVNSDYLSEKIHRMALYNAKNQIKNRYNYLVKMIQQDIQR